MVRWPRVFLFFVSFSSRPEADALKATILNPVVKSNNVTLKIVHRCEFFFFFFFFLGGGGGGAQGKSLADRTLRLYTFYDDRAQEHNFIMVSWFSLL